MNERMLTKERIEFLRQPVKCSKCNIVRQRQSMCKDKWGYLVCLKGCENRVLHKGEERVNGKVVKVKEVTLDEFNNR